MILEEETFEEFGYHPQDLKSQSHKKILAACDNCGKIREIIKYNYRDLCHMCAMQMEETIRKLSEAHKGMYFSEEHKRKISAAEKGKVLSEETKQKMSNTHKGMHHSEESKRKISDNHANFRGAQSGMWKGGVSFEPYCIKFDDEFKERVREYWNRKCILCEKTELENGRKLDVHHVMYNKDTCCDDSILLFVVLCNSCHSKTNGKREYWEKEFEKIIYSRNIDGKCFYTKKEMEKKCENEKENGNEI